MDKTPPRDIRPTDVRNFDCRNINQSPLTTDQFLAKLHNMPHTGRMGIAFVNPDDMDQLLMPDEAVGSFQNRDGHLAIMTGYYNEYPVITPADIDVKKILQSPLKEVIVHTKYFGRRNIVDVVNVPYDTYNWIAIVVK